MRKTAAVTAALALMATPAFAQGQGDRGQSQTKSPAQLCAKKSKRVVPGTKRQSEYVGCIEGVKRFRAHVAQGKTRANPARSCRTGGIKLSNRKAPGAQRSPYAQCVRTYAHQQRQHNRTQS